MKITLTSEAIEKSGYSAALICYLLYLNQSPNKEQVINTCTIKGFKTADGKLAYQGAKLLNQVLKDSIEKSDMSDSEIEELVKKMKEFFPKGIKSGSVSWRGNTRDLVLRMKKFFNLYGNYSTEQILAATEQYVKLPRFSFDKTYMRTLEYFIMKSERKEGADGRVTIEDKSELANILENGIEENSTKSDNWLNEDR